MAQDSLPMICESLTEMIQMIADCKDDGFTLWYCEKLNERETDFKYLLIFQKPVE